MILGCVSHGCLYKFGSHKIDVKNIMLYDMCDPTWDLVTLGENVYFLVY